MSEIERLENVLHEMLAHPDFEYAITQTQRKCEDFEYGTMQARGFEAYKDSRDSFTDKTYWRRRRDHPKAVEEEDASYDLHRRRRACLEWLFSTKDPNMSVAEARAFILSTWNFRSPFEIIEP